LLVWSANIPLFVRARSEGEGTAGLRQVGPWQKALVFKRRRMLPPKTLPSE